MAIPTIEQLETIIPYDPDAGTINNVPQINTNPLEPNNASFELGFPSITMPLTPDSGLPPKGQDMNGILSRLSQLNLWYSVGGGFNYNATFYNNTNPYITGYPVGARVKRADNEGYWISTVDNNQTDPDSALSENWQPDTQVSPGYITFTSNGQTFFIVNKLTAAKNIIIVTDAPGITPASFVEILLPEDFLKTYHINNLSIATLIVKTTNASSNSITIPKGPSSTVMSVLSLVYVSDLSQTYLYRPNIGNNGYYSIGSGANTSLNDVTSTIINLNYQSGMIWIGGDVIVIPFTGFYCITISTFNEATTIDPVTINYTLNIDGVDFVLQDSLTFQISGTLLYSFTGITQPLSAGSTVYLSAILTRSSLVQSRIDKLTITAIGN